MAKLGENQTGRIRSGLTFASGLALLYAIVVFIPALGYLDLMLGGAVGLPVSWFVLILWVELGRVFGHPVSKQEATLIYLMSSSAIFIQNAMIYRVFFRDSPIVKFFGIADEIPWWWVPPAETGIGTALRTFFHPAWAVPILINVVDVVFWAMAFWAMALLGRRLFMEIEDLPFPIEQMNARAIVTLTETRKKEDLNILYTAGTIGFIYAFILYAYPFIMQAWTGKSMSIIPVPWFDFSAQLTPIMPGAVLGVATDLMPIAASFVLPINVVIGIVIGSLAIYFFGNWISVTHNIYIQPWWSPGMSMSLALQRSTMFLWGCILIGLGLGAGLGPVLKNLPVIFRRSETKGARRLAETFSLKRWVLIPMAASYAVSIALYVILVPDFPIMYMVPFLIGFPILMVLTDGRMLGTTGISFSGQVNNVYRLFLWSSGYPKVDVWFVPWPWLTGIGPQLSNLKVAQLTDTSARSLIKAYWIFLPVGLAFGYLTANLFWSIAPIPSARYPGASMIWPINVTYEALWMKGRYLGLFKLDWLVISLVLGIIISLALDFGKSPVSFIAIAAGMVTYPPYAMTYLIGILIRVLFWRIIGKESFEAKNQLIAAGILLGEVIAVAVGVSVALVVTSIWTLPF